MSTRHAKGSHAIGFSQNIFKTYYNFWEAFQCNKNLRENGYSHIIIDYDSSDGTGDNDGEVNAYFPCASEGNTE